MRALGRILLAAVALVLAASGTATADVYDDNPATASRGPGELYVFARGSTGEILERHRLGGTWSDWSSIGGSAGSGPAAVAYRGDILVFIRGTDGGIYQNSLSSGRWTGWSGLGGNGTSAPSASARRGSTNYLDLEVRGLDNAIWHQTFVPTKGWTGFSTLGGLLTSAPSAVSQSDEVLNVFSRGSDNSLVQRGWNGAAWSEWLGLGGGLLGAPAAVSRTRDALNIYVRGGNDALYARSWTPAGWSDWFLLDGSTRLSSAPAGAGDGPNHEWVVARVGGSIALKEWTIDTGWGSWQDFGPVAVQSPVPAPTAPPAAAPLPTGHISLKTGIACTPAHGKLRVNVNVATPKGKAKARVTKIVFFTKGKGRKVRVDRKAPFQVHIPINRPAGTKGRVYARVYYKRTARGATHRKVVSRRYTVCR
jgi:hypothetical protein